MGNIIQERLGVIIGSLVTAFLIAAGSAYVSIAVAGEKIEHLEAADVQQQEALSEGLRSIDRHLEKIAAAMERQTETIQRQSVDAAKFHHEHAR
jgi:hypothetical protein